MFYKARSGSPFTSTAAGYLAGGTGRVPANDGDRDNREGTSGMMHVAMVAGTYRPERDGVAHYVLRLREALARRGVSSSVLTTRGAAREAYDRPG